MLITLVADMFKYLIIIIFIGSGTFLALLHGVDDGLLKPAVEVVEEIEGTMKWKMRAAMRHGRMQHTAMMLIQCSGLLREQHA